MPSRIAAIMAALKLSSGNLDRRLKPWVFIAGLLLILAPLVLFIIAAWRAEPTTETVVLYALFVTFGVILVGLTRDDDPPPPPA